MGHLEDCWLGAVLFLTCGLWPSFQTVSKKENRMRKAFDSAHLCVWLKVRQWGKSRHAEKKIIHWPSEAPVPAAPDLWSDARLFEWKANFKPKPFTQSWSFLLVKTNILLREYYIYLKKTPKLETVPLNLVSSFCLVIFHAKILTLGHLRTL